MQNMHARNRVFLMPCRSVVCATLLLAFPSGAASTAPSPPARIAALDKFLLFDVIFHEQLNKQRRALMFFLDLAMKTKRTLVLPRARLLRKKGFGQFHPNADYVPWGEVR